MGAINPEQASRLLRVAAARLQEIGNRSYHYALLTAGKTLPQLELGVRHYVGADNDRLRPGRLPQLRPYTTPNGAVTFRSWTQKVAESSEGYMRPRSREPDFNNSYPHWQRRAADAMRGLGAILLAKPNLQVSAAWGERLDMYGLDLFATVYYPEDPPPHRKKVMLVLQGQTFNKDGYIHVKSGQRSPDWGFYYVVRYGVDPPPPLGKR